MNKYAEVMVLVEGPTEQKFVKELLGPYLNQNGVYLKAPILDKPGQKGGDVKFARAKNDIGKLLKQRADICVTLLVDYYGIKADWPGYEESKRQNSHAEKARVMNEATAAAVQTLFPEQNPAERFIPYVSMHELEALYFSAPDILAGKLGVEKKKIDEILQTCGEPEKVNDSTTTAPSKRLEKLSDRFKKTSTGIAIAKDIGISAMRKSCPCSMTGYASWS